MEQDASTVSDTPMNMGESSELEGCETTKSISESIHFSPSSFAQLYKNTGITQESILERKREEFFNEQKKKHECLLDSQRDFSSLFEEVDVDNTVEEPMDLEYVEKRYRKRIPFKITMNNWFTDVPEDLEEKWIVKFCPEGKRRLIVSNNRVTKSFNKFGHRVCQFYSCLPGGGKCKQSITESVGLTVLDCIFNRKTKTYFILDLLVWNNLNFINCPTKMRNIWLRNKYADFPECFEPYDVGSYTFKLLMDHKADRNTIKKEMFEYDLKCEVMCDGLVFYDENAAYKPENMSLVVWLKPFMLPEKLQIEIPARYEEKKPSDYVNLRSYLLGIQSRPKKQYWCTKKRVSEAVEMETEPEQEPNIESGNVEMATYY